jgi:hypothetical protein
MNADARLAELAKPKPTLPRWEYEGNEQVLIDQIEKEERENSNE